MHLCEVASHSHFDNSHFISIYLRPCQILLIDLDWCWQSWKLDDVRIELQIGNNYMRNDEVGVVGVPFKGSLLSYWIASDGWQSMVEDRVCVQHFAYSKLYVN